ncbi:MAG TPA: TIGR04211 family SH3 domain-containing protein [Nitrosomonas europaea]|uniref:TIGR04211 family SH3 domain-containing protein n=1 Tax=Nitrosomonas europaea TaxID=915 RepID=UPI002493028B|nr:TIGR04211 family SH3 domain-containing protein [Nitrosomonas europaea]HRN81197.1 TIGR04211 family SH3 domain-containing protein [Nitrosomonas europaea]HRO56158.1 TIGR04211 family SH3 domain-containing protein [Nitrosomonas europaea]HRQ07722.1 TIGR04211 family SH3 domain-containing protein [Nitrosomonas europaea]HUM73224.1 TIGR04211 family SH3 domain-containing protein [Nitrosomonas europaea]
MNKITYFLAASMFFVFLWGVPLTARAEKSYASDQVEVLMRTGPSQQHAIVRMLKSGVALEVLERDQNKGYSRVRTTGGTEGWVLSRYLMAEPAARELLEKLSSDFSGSDSRPDSIRAQADLVRHELGMQKKQAETLEKDNKRLEAELSKIRQLSANVVQLNGENQEMRQQVADLKMKLGELEQENHALSGQIEREWFYAGALVLFAGLFLGLVIPRIQWRKRSRYNDF